MLLLRWCFNSFNIYVHLQVTLKKKLNSDISYNSKKSEGMNRKKYNLKTTSNVQRSLGLVSLKHVTRINTTRNCINSVEL